jgi:hypothetical protein
LYWENTDLNDAADNCKRILGVFNKSFGFNGSVVPLQTEPKVHPYHHFINIFKHMNDLPELRHETLFILYYSGNCGVDARQSMYTPFANTTPEDCFSFSHLQCLLEAHSGPSIAILDSWYGTAAVRGGRHTFEVFAASGAHEVPLEHPGTGQPGHFTNSFITTLNRIPPQGWSSHQIYEELLRLAGIRCHVCIQRLY